MFVLYTCVMPMINSAVVGL